MIDKGEIMELAPNQRTSLSQQFMTRVLPRMLFAAMFLLLWERAGRLNNYPF